LCCATTWEKLKQNHTIVSEETLVPRGTLASFTGARGANWAS